MKKLMRILLTVLVLMLPSAALAAPHVFDNADVFTDAEELEISDAVTAFITETGMDYAVVTIDLNIGSRTHHDVAREYYLQLDLGTGDDSSGALYMLNMNKANRAETIYVDGKMMYYLTDDRQESVLDQSNPLLVRGEYKAAVIAAINSVEGFVKKGIPEGQYIYDEETGTMVTAPYKTITGTELLIGAAAALLIGFIFVLTVFSRYKLKGSTYHYDYRANSDMEMNESTDQYLNTTVTRTRRAQSNGGGGGGFGGGGRTTMSGGGGSSSSRGF